MKNYSIVRIGNEYVVQAGEKSILKIASRRRAAKLVTDAAELLDQQPIADRSTTTHQSLVISGSCLAPPKFLDDQALSLMHRGGTPPPNGRLAIWKDRL